MSNKFKVTITEKLKLTVEVAAEDQRQAEQMVADDWRKSRYILDADNFASVDFEAVPAEDTW
ncbi:MAG: DpnD/PcfM family protein [Oscillospiraceae bacterium]|nr:DpnD/PcfM family protein [Oscillospiraceae bacterium]